MRGIKSAGSVGRRYFVLVNGKVEWEGCNPGAAWAYTQGRGTGAICREWSPKSSPVSPLERAEKTRSRNRKPSKTRET